MQPVLVSGATGRIGSAVVAELLASGVPVRALSRNPGTADLPAKVEIVAGDFTEPASLGPALQGVRTVFLLWTAPVDSAAAVIERLASEPRRVVFLSSPHRTPHPFFQQPNPMARMHAEIERLIARCRTRVDLRSARDVRVERAVLVGPRDPEGGRGPVAVRCGRDGPDRRARRRGRSGARPLRGRPRGARLRPHGPRVAEPGGAGQPDRGRARSSDSVRGVVARGVPRRDGGYLAAPVVDMLLTAWGATMGRPAYVTSTVADVVGVPARTFREWVSDHEDAFRTAEPE